MGRPLSIPDPAKTVHFVGDVHAGAISQSRLDIVSNDIRSGRCPGAVARVQVGDSIDDGSTTQDAVAAAFYALLTDVPMRTIPGNHDTYGSRTVASWAASLGVLATPWTWDLGFVKIIGLGDVDNTTPASPSNNLYLPQTHLDYLAAAALAAGQTPVWVAAHAPLENTVTGPTTGDNPQFSSAETAFFEHGPLASSADDTSVRAVLAAHSNIKGYFCGHTHSSIHAPGFFSTLTLGGSNMAHVNCSALFYVGRTVEWTDPIRTIYATQKDDGSALELRIWNHGSHTFDSVNGSGERVHTVTY